MKMFWASVALLLLFHVNGASSCAARERDSLLQFKTSVLDPSNTLLNSWHGFNCCQWNGIQCNPRTHHVIRLDLHCSEDAYYDDMSLRNQTGDVLSPLFNLKHLEHLDLSLNSFHGVSIPPGFGKLKSLRYLDLSGAGFSGDIPRELGNMSFLYYLDLSRYYLRYLGPSDSYAGLRMEEMQTWTGNMTVLREIRMNGVDMSSVESDDLDNALSTMYSLARLEMAGCSLFGGIPPSLASLANLTHLDLSFNDFNGSIPSALPSLPRLQHLELTYNMLEGHIPPFGDRSHTLGKPFPLVNIDLSINQFDGPIPPMLFTAFPSLQSVDLSYNQLMGSILSPAVRLRHLTQLHLNSNSLTGKIPTSLALLSSLVWLDLSNNKLSDNIPPSIGQLLDLETLDLSSNKLEGIIPLSISKLSELYELNVQSNQLTGIFSDSHLLNLRRLRSIDISDNQLTVKFRPTWIPKFSLDYLGLSSCNMEGGFPTFLITQYEIYDVDISSNSLAGEIPSWIWALHLSYLNLSHNLFVGVLPGSLIGSSLITIDLHNNSLQGHLPLLPDGLAMLDVSKNQLTGSIPTEFGEHQNLQILLLSGNHLRGGIPPLLCGTLKFLDLSGNNLTGKIPAFYKNPSSIQVLNLENNFLKGELSEQFINMSFLQTLKLGGNRLNSYIPASLAKCQELEILDLNNNNMRGFIPKWIWKLSSLKVLILRSNRFEGRIPSELIALPLLQILDLSSNRFSGVIPLNITSLQALKNKTVGSNVFTTSSEVLGRPVNDTRVIERDVYYTDRATIINKAQEMEYVRSLALVKCIDLSNNNIAGEIPPNIGLLEGLVILNVSRNNIIHEIPKSLGKMVMLESLDLSHNQLFGGIPLELQSLTFLGYLDFSHNNLSGSIPQGGNLLTFDESSFSNNSDLCGLQLNTTCCGHHPCPPSIPPMIEGDNVDEEEDDIWWGIALGMSYAVGFSIVIGILCLTTTWSRKCFHVMDTIIAYLFQRFKN